MEIVSDDHWMELFKQIKIIVINILCYLRSWTPKHVRGTGGLGLNDLILLSDGRVKTFVFPDNFNNWLYNLPFYIYLLCVFCFCIPHIHFPVSVWLAFVTVSTTLITLHSTCSTILHRDQLITSLLRLNLWKGSAVVSNTQLVN